MGGFFTCDLNPLLSYVCSSLSNGANYICGLEKNLAALEKAMKVLRSRRADVLTRVQTKESEGLQRFNRVQEWLTDVEDIQNQVYELLLPRTDELERLCLCGLCSKHLKKSYDYGKSVFEMLKEVEDLESAGNFEEVAGRPTIPVVVERPLQPEIFGQDKMLERAWEHLMDDRTWIMGLYGMGGVGKTTLLEQINNKFRGENDGFDIVIYIVVSSDLRVEKIQDEIAEKLGFGVEDWKQKERGQKTTDIYTRMKNMKFVLLLDDIWAEVDLKGIGVPYPTKKNRCKVVFTTRSREVCGHMGVDDPMEVKCLDSNEAWDLFRYRVGKITLESHPDILELACQVARKCHGLPLALNITGKNMACKRTVQEWEQAIEVLASSAVDFPGMEDHIFRVLLYSYDGLRDEHVQSCFQYCALFPEDFSIEKEKLVDYWICEGFIDEKQSIKKAKNDAHAIIGTLVQASLLIEDNKSTVKMHDVIREMALRIASDFGKDKERCIVRAGVGLREVPTVENWRSVRRMSLMQNDIEMVSDSPNCPELTTLLFLRNKMENISCEFFKNMPRLVVLDLSHNRFFNGLPEEISALVALRYLDLSNTGIQRLHAGLLKLNKLIYLNLEQTGLESISGISNLSSLRTLLLRRGYQTRIKMSQDLNVMEELQLLDHLELVTIEIGSSAVANQLLNASASKVVNAIQEISIESLEEEEKPIILTFPNMAVLSKLEMYGSKISGINIEKGTSSWNKNLTSPAFPNLSTVIVDHCHDLKDLTWLLFAPNLKALTVARSTQIEDIICKEKALNIFTEEEVGTIIPFAKLEHFEGYDMPKLKSIYWSDLPFQRLRTFFIVRCPNLRKLPLDSKSGRSIAGEEFFIYNEEEWKDEATKDRFLRTIQRFQ